MIRDFDEVWARAVPVDRQELKERLKTQRIKSLPQDHPKYPEKMLKDDPRTGSQTMKSMKTSRSASLEPVRTTVRQPALGKLGRRVTDTELGEAGAVPPQLAAARAGKFEKVCAEEERERKDSWSCPSCGKEVPLHQEAWKRNKLQGAWLSCSFCKEESWVMPNCQYSSEIANEAAPNKAASLCESGRHRSTLFATDWAGMMLAERRAGNRASEREWSPAPDPD